MRKVYFENTPLQVAQEKYFSLFNFQPKVELISVTESLGRVTAESVFSKLSMPNYNASAMDGIAVKAESTYSTSILKLHQDYEVVDTGDPIPKQFDAVVMIEYVQQIDEETVEILESVSPWTHIRQIGEDIVTQEMILPIYHKIRPVDQGALLAGGIIEIPVLTRPKVAIIPTGDELVEPTLNLKAGDIIEFNGTVLSSYVKEWGGEPIYRGAVRDDLQEIKQAVDDALEEADIVVINAGSSLGRGDYTPEVIAQTGELIVHGLATRPAKPVALGKAFNGKPIIGVPGYPVSAYLTMDWFVKPLMDQFSHHATPERRRQKVKLGRRIVSKMGVEDFIRITIGKVNGSYIANPLSRSAGVTMTMVKADGLLRIPMQILGYEQGEEVEIELYNSLEKIENTIMLAGSHDIIIDLLASSIKKEYYNYSVTSSNIGSLAGLLAVAKGECHAASINLLDEKTGDYNISFINKYLAENNVVLINLAYRQQGWILQKGNPKHFETINDLTRVGIRYLNRQRGAGTRILFDYLLKQTEISEKDIYGYTRESFSHLSLAAAIKGDNTDVGLGIKSSAEAMGLDFVPVAEERLDLVMSKEFFDSDAGKVLLELINSTQFKTEIEAIGGYSCRDTGSIIYQQ